MILCSSYYYPLTDPSKDLIYDAVWSNIIHHSHGRVDTFELDKVRQVMTWQTQSRYDNNFRSDLGLAKIDYRMGLCQSVQ